MKKICLIVCCLLSSLTILSFVGCSSSPSSHTHSYTSSVVEPTCSEKGYTKYVCSCGDSYSENFVDEVAHKGSTKCQWCGIDYFNELKSLVIEYGTYASGYYAYTGKSASYITTVTPSILYNVSENSIILYALQNSVNWQVSISIPSPSTDTSIADGEYAFAYTDDKATGVGILNARTFSDATKSLSFSKSSGITSSNSSSIASICADFSKILLNNALIPLLEKGTDNITVAHFGFVNF